MIPELVGRSSSHFTRVTRIFAHELEVEHRFRPVFDLTTLEPAAYAGNPALKIPIWIDEHGPLFGCENICRALVRRAGRKDVVLRGDTGDRLVANAEELVLHVMVSEVTLIMAKMAGTTPPPAKVVRSVETSFDSLDMNLSEVLTALPSQRALSFFEVALFCTLEHLPFREVLDISRWTSLVAFASRFAERASAVATTYHFDKPAE